MTEDRLPGEARWIFEPNLQDMRCPKFSRHLLR